MPLNVSGKQLRLPKGATVEFAYPIREVAEVGNVVVVLLDVPAHESMTENVFGVSQDGDVVWQIEPIPDITNDPTDCYTGFVSATPGKLALCKWGGIGVEIDPNTGRVLRHWIGK